MKVFAVKVNSDGDNYIFVYRNQPTREQVIRRLLEIDYGDEATEEDYHIYDRTTSITISEQELIENAD